MMKRSVPLALALSLLLLPVTPTSGFAGPPAADPLPLPAFPGAEGYGALAKGGRGGRVIEVTNLDDSGPGSLRAAVNASGPRIVVFRVGGTIELKSDIVIRGEDQAYLTIAGQTAPGGGILLKNYGLHIMDTHDIVVRYIRIRPGQWAFQDRWVYGILVYGYQRETYNVILDHISESWHVDDNAIWGNVHDVTLQWSIFAEGTLYANATQYQEAYKRGTGLMWGPDDQVRHLSVHHNLLANNFYRNPAPGGGEHQIINNVISNPGWSATTLTDDGPTLIDFIGNYYQRGPDTRAGIREIFWEGGDPAVASLHLQGSFGWNYSPGDPYAIVQSTNYQKRASPLSPGPTIPISIQGYEEAKELVIARAGAVLPERDAVDERLVHEFLYGCSRKPSCSGEGSMYMAYPVIATGTPSADSDHDGMPDAWEVNHGLNPADMADGPQDADGDGYTNVEEYLSELAGDTPPTPLPGDCTLFVSASAGSDANDGRSDATPFRTIQKAADIVNPGDTVCVEDGVYTDSNNDGAVLWIDRGGEPDHWVTFKSINKWGAVLDGQSNETSFGVLLYDHARYIRIEGFEIRGVGWQGIMSNRPGVHHIVIAGNHIHHVGVRSTTSAYGQDGVFQGSGTSDHTYEGNLIHDIGRTNIDQRDHGIYLSGSSNDTIVNNVFYNIASGSAVGPTGGDSSIRNLRILNNTFIGPPRQNIGHIWVAEAIDTLTIRNNLFYQPGEFAIDCWPNDCSTVKNAVVSDNLAYGPDRFLETPTGEFQLSDNLLNIDPRFIDIANQDFHVAPGSPAIDAGSPQDAPSTDFEGNPRPQGAGYDIGAYEFQQGDPTTFADVPASHWAYADIEKLYQGGYVVGCQATPERKYCPEATLSRAEAAVFVVRGHHTASFLPPEPNPSDLHFADVARGTWYAKWVEQLWQDQFTAGCAVDPLRFCPEVPHTRAEAAVFFVRMLRGKDYVSPEPGSLPYADVAPGTWYAKWVAAAYEAGLTRDCEDPPSRGDDRFRPGEAITRAEAACMMVRAKSLVLPGPTATPRPPPTVTPTPTAGMACTHYASPAGGGNGSSPDSPFQVADFWPTAGPGKTLCLLDGVYRGKRSMIDPPDHLSGAAGSPITVKALRDGKVTIDGENIRMPGLLEYNDHFVLEGFNAHSSSSHVIEVTRSNHNVVRRVIAWDASPSLNSMVFGSHYGSDNLFEDVAGWGGGRKVFGLFEDTRTIWRRCFFRWSSHSLVGGTYRLGLTVSYSSTGTLTENCIGTWDQLPESSESFEDLAVFGFDRDGGGGHRLLGSFAYLLSGQERLPYLFFFGPDDHRIDLTVDDLMSYTDIPEKEGQLVNIGTMPRFRYVNGTLTDEPLWPWPMNERIQQAMMLSGYDQKGGLDGKGGIDLMQVLCQVSGGQWCFSSQGAVPAPVSLTAPGTNPTLTVSLATSATATDHR